MNIKTWNKLEKLGFQKEWLDDVRIYWVPKKNCKYEMLITNIEELDMDPRHGVYIERTTFDNDRDLSRIHAFFEGFAYVMTDVATGEVIGEGIIDGAPFDEMGEWTGTEWCWQETEREEKMKKSWYERQIRENKI